MSGILGPYRQGPWPGLTARGAALVFAHGVLLAAGQLLLGNSRNVIWLGVLTVIPMALATRVVQVPGVASAVAVVYLLPRTLVSLVDPSIEPPPPLLVAAVVFDVLAWVRREDFQMPRRNRRRTRDGRQITTVRLVIACVVAGVVLALVEPPFAAFFSATGTGSSPPAPPTAPPRSTAGDL